MSKLEIYKVKDKHERHYITKKHIFNLPMRLLIVGKSQRSGKSNYLVNLLLRPEFYLNDFDGENMFIVSGSIKTDMKLRTLVKQKDIPDENLFEEYDETDIEGIYEYIEEQFYEAVENGEKPPQSIIVFDDMSFSGALKNRRNGMISKIFSNGRHINLSCIVTAQKYSDINTAARENATGLILFTCSDKQLDLIADDHSYIQKKSFKKLFRQNTSKTKHSNFVINYDNDIMELYLNENYEVIQIPQDEFLHSNDKN